MESNLFESVPKNNKYLSMFFRQDREPDYEKVVKTLDFSKKQIAAAARVPLDSVRYDNRISKDLQDRVREWAVVLALVAEHFNGDPQKTELWFRIPNPLLGNISPRDMIRFGRFKKLLKFIQNAVSENKPP